jgi:polyamine oxidase
MAVLSLAVKLLAASVCIHGFAIPHAHPRDTDSDKPNAKILILGGGVAGVIAARTFHDQGIKDFIIIEARDELGGRVKSTSFGGATVELGANWVQGTQSSPGGRANPIYKLVEKHGVKTHPSDFLDFGEPLSWLF